MKLNKNINNSAAGDGCCVSSCSLLRFLDDDGIVVAASAVSGDTIRTFGAISHLPAPFGEGRGTLLYSQEEQQTDCFPPHLPACEA